MTKVGRRDGHGHMVQIEYDGVRRNLDHLPEPTQQAMIREAKLYAGAGMRPPTLSVIAEGVDVTKQPELWPAVHREYRGPGRLEILRDPLD